MDLGTPAPVLDLMTGVRHLLDLPLYSTHGDYVTGALWTLDTQRRDGRSLKMGCIPSTRLRERFKVQAIGQDPGHTTNSSYDQRLRS